MKRVAVILSGCGVFDGAEIHESVLVLLALDRANAQVTCAAPDVAQHHVTDHLTNRPAPESRRALVEAARIARGHIQPLNRLKAAEFDAVIVPGGFGAATTLCNFGDKAAACEVEPSVAAFLTEAQRAGKPLGFVCIAPAIAARLFGAQGVQLTIGHDAGTAKAIEGTGAKHVDCPVHDIVVDRRLKIVTTPAYMLARRITEAETGINKLVKAVLELA